MSLDSGLVSDSWLHENQDEVPTLKLLFRLGPAPFLPADHARPLAVLHEWRLHAGGHRRQHQNAGPGGGRRALRGGAQRRQPGALRHSSRALCPGPDL